MNEQVAQKLLDYFSSLEQNCIRKISRNYIKAKLNLPYEIFLQRI